ncbi:hypothetical protein ACFMB7_28300 [Bacillus toyonensis]
MLHRVKELLLLPNLEMATLQQVSDFYEVDNKSIDKLCSRHKDEFKSDGVLKYSKRDILESLSRHLVGLETIKGVNVLSFEDGTSMRISNRGSRVFPKRAILRVGMLLRDSEVAKEVRTQLLNIEEKASADVKTADINEEMRLQMAADAYSYQRR